MFALTDFSQRPTAENSDQRPQLQTAELLQQQKQVPYYLYIMPWEWKLWIFQLNSFPSAGVFKIT